MKVQVFWWCQQQRPGACDAVSQQCVRREGEAQGRAGARCAQRGGLMDDKQFCPFLSASENKIMSQGFSKAGSAALLFPRLVLLSQSPCWAERRCPGPSSPFACAGGPGTGSPWVTSRRGQCQLPLQGCDRVTHKAQLWPARGWAVPERCWWG